LTFDLQLIDKFGKNFQNVLAELNKLLLVELKARTSWFERFESIFGILNLIKCVKDPFEQANKYENN
jgi:hypothetical protein